MVLLVISAQCSSAAVNAEAVNGPRLYLEWDSKVKWSCAYRWQVVEKENKGQRREGKMRRWVQERKGFGQKHRWEKESG